MTMNSIRLSVLAAIVLGGMPSAGPALAGESEVKLWKTPGGGIQPQALVDERGRVHMVYFNGKPGGGDLFYIRLESTGESFSEPKPVNTKPGSAVAVGTIRGAQLAVGRNGRVHVAWNGASAVPGSSYAGVPLWYARLGNSGDAFEPQRDLITYAGGLDGGGSITADTNGVVRVLWHGAAATNTLGEAGRALFMATSTDDGRAFGPEAAISPPASGACGCCGMRAFSDRAGRLFALFRSAPTTMDRAELLIASHDGGKTFRTLNRSPWLVASCPMSSAAFGESSLGVVAAWESEGRIEWARIANASLGMSAPRRVAGTERRKHPVVAVNQEGKILVAWTEGTGWKKGGTLAWQVFDSEGRPTETKGRLADAVPVWGLLSAVARPDGSFLLFH